MNDLSTEQLRRLLTITQQVDELQAEKQRILGGKRTAKPKRRMSKSARLKISKQVKARWAAKKAKGEKKL